MQEIKMFRHRTFSIRNDPVTVVDPYTVRGGNLPYTMSKYARNTVVDKVVGAKVGLRALKAKYVVGTSGVRGLGDKNEYVEQVVKDESNPLVSAENVDKEMAPVSIEPVDEEMRPLSSEQVDEKMASVSANKSFKNVVDWIQNLESEISEEKAKSVSSDMQSVADYFDKLDSPVASTVSEMQSLLENTLAAKLKKALAEAGTSKRGDEEFESIKKRKTALSAYAKIINGELKTIVNNSLKRKTKGDLPEAKKWKKSANPQIQSPSSGSLYLPSESNDSLTEGVTGRVLRKRKVKSYRESTSTSSS